MYTAAVIDDSLFRLAAKMFNERDFQKALEYFHQFKSFNYLDSSNLTYEHAFLEMLINFNLATENQPEFFQKTGILATKYINSNLIENSLPKSEKTLQNAQVYGLLGECCSKLNDLEQAKNFFEKALQYDTDKSNKVIWFKLFVIYCKLEMSNVARLLAKEIEKWTEYEIPIHFVLLDLSIKEQKKSLALCEILPLINQLEKLDFLQINRLVNRVLDISEFRIADDIIKKSSIVKSSIVQFPMEQARIHFHNKEFKKAIAILENDEHLKGTAYGSFVLANSYQAIQQYDNAFKAYTISAIEQERQVSINPDNIKFSDCIQKYKEVNLDFIKEKYESNIKVTTTILPTFLIGFPRSGTTLLDTIMGTQSEITVLSEKPILAKTIVYMEVALGKNYPYDLDKLSFDELSELREHYLTSLSLYTAKNDELTQNKQIFIDKHPLNTIHIPFILLLFPEAKFIFSLRHPVDCVLSCFQQNFKLNNEMAFLTTLEKCTLRYIDVMEHFETCLQKFNINIHYVKYENLLSQLDIEVPNVFNFIQHTNIDNKYKKFNESAKNSITSTSSKDQVTQPLYQSSKGKWRKYEQYIQESIKSLEYFTHKFGYVNTEE